MERVGFGVYRDQRDLAGKTVGEVRRDVEAQWAMPPEAVAHCGNVSVSDDWVIPKGAVIDFFNDKPLANPDHMAVLAALQAEYDTQPEAIQGRLAAQAKIEETLA